MECSRSAADPGTGRPGRAWPGAGETEKPERLRASLRKAGLVAGAALCAMTALPAAVAQAGPGPGIQDLKDEATKAQNQLETLTEQYNGLKVQLDQAVRAEKVAQETAARDQAAFQAVQQKIGQLAATSYMHAGGEDPAMSMLATRNPQTLLDQASTLHYFAAQNGTKVQALTQALQTAVRAGKDAQDRAGQVQALRDQVDQKRKTLEQAYNSARDKVIKQDPSQLGDLPPVTGGSSKAIEALQWALRQRGRPYSWGAAGPYTFDCSGLTMWAYSKVGINLPHFTGSQWNAGVHISKDQLQPGDLVFFYSDLHHMGMYVGNGMIVHAPHSGDVVRLAPLAGRPFAGAVRVA